MKLFNKVGFISGFTTGGSYVKDIENNYITIPGKTYNQVSFKHLEFISHNNNWQFIPHLKRMEDFLPKRVESLPEYTKDLDNSIKDLIV